MGINGNLDNTNVDRCTCYTSPKPLLLSTATSTILLKNKTKQASNYMAPNWLFVLASDANEVQIVHKIFIAFSIQKVTEKTLGSLYQWYISLESR